MPDPVVCFAGSSFSQEQCYELSSRRHARRGGLDHVGPPRDRRALGVRSLQQPDRRAARRPAHPVRLPCASTATTAPWRERIGRFDVCLLAVVTGPLAFELPRPAPSRGVGDLPVDRRIRPAALGGAARRTTARSLRIAGTGVEQVGAALREHLRFLVPRCSAMIPGPEMVNPHASDTPRDSTSCVLHQAGFLAQKRLARGLRLNYPEAVALIATQLLEFIRDGRSVAELMDLGRQFLGRADVMDGVARDDRRGAGRRHVSRRHEARDRASSDRGRARRPRRSRSTAASCPCRRTPDRRSQSRGRVDAVRPGASSTAARRRHRAQRRARGDVELRGHQPRRSADPGRQPLSLRRDQSRARRSIAPRPTACASTFRPAPPCASSRARRKTVTLVAIAGARVIRGGNALARADRCRRGASRASAASDGIRHRRIA